MSVENQDDFKEFRARVSDYLKFKALDSNTDVAADLTPIKDVKQTIELLENLNNIVIIVDKDLNICYESPSIEMITGYTPEERQGKSAFELIHPEDLPFIQKSISKFIDGKLNKLEVRSRLKCKDASWRFVDIAVQTYRDSTGTAGVIIKLHDTTDFKQTEKALDESRERLNLAIKSTGLAIWDQNFKTDETFRDKRWTAMLGYEPGEVGPDTKSWKELIHPDDLPLVEKEAEEHEAGRKDTYEVEHRMKTKNGQWKWILNWGKIIERDSDGRPIRALGTHLDITKRKQAEIAFCESEDKLSTIIEHINEMYYIHDTRRQVSYVSPQCMRIFGYSPEEMMIKWTSLLTDHPMNQNCFEFTEKALKTGNRQKPYLLEVRRKDGKKLTIEVDESPLKDNNGIIIGITGAVRDITERKRAEEALRDSQERMQSLSDGSFEAIFFSEKGICIDQNLTAEKMFGYTASEAIGRSGTDWIVPEDRDLVMKNMLAGYEEPYQVTALRKDGTTFPVEIQARMFDYQGRRVRVTSLSDVTERKQAEVALRESEEKYRNIVEMSPDGIATISLTGFMTSCNDAFLELTGFDQNDLVGKHFSKLPTLRFQDIPKYLKVLESMVRGEIPKPFDFKWTHKSGEDRLGEARLSLMKTKGKTSGFQLIATDITDRKKAEEKLKGERERARNYLNIAGVMLVVLDSTGTVTLVNPKGCHILGYKEEEILGKNWFDNFLPKDIVADVRVIFQRLLAGELEPLETVEGDVLTASGHLKTIAWHNSLLYDETGSISGTLSSGEDITERKQAEEALKESKEKYRAIVTAFDGQILICSQDYKIEFMNQRYIDRLGFDATGQSCYKAIHNRDDKCPWCNGDTIFKGETLRKEIKGRDSDTWYYNVNTPIYHVDGSVSKLSLQLDVTEQKEAEEALRKSEANLALAQKVALIGSWEWNLEIDKQYWSDEIFRIYGLEPKKHEASLELIWDTIYPDDKDNVGKAIGAARQQGIPYNIEYRIVLPNGDMRFINGIGKPVKDETGKVVRIHGTSQNITERKQAEEALQDSEQRFRRLVETMTDGLVMVDEDQRFTYLNNRFSEILGRPQIEIINRHVSDFTDDDNKKILTEQWEKRKKGDFSPYELDWLRKDGTRVTTIISPKPLMSNTGSFEGSFGIITDITVRKRIEVLGKAKIQLSESLRGISGINDCLKSGCDAIKNAGLFKHIIFMVNGEDGKTTNIEYIGLKKKELTLIRNLGSNCLKNAHSQADTNVRIGNSYVIPDNGKPVSGLENEISNDNFRLSLADNERILVPFGGEVMNGGGCLVVDTTYKGTSLNRNSIAFLEDVTGMVAKKVNEIHYLKRLKSDKMKLEDKNIALREVMANVEGEKLAIKREIANKVDQFIVPLINRLENVDGSVNRTYMDLLAKNVQELVYPSTSLIHLYRKLSPREVEICDLIRNGLASKQIAETLHISLATIQKHRERIRNKLGIANKNINLASFLHDPGA